MMRIVPLYPHSYLDEFGERHHVDTIEVEASDREEARTIWFARHGKGLRSTILRIESV